MPTAAASLPPCTGRRIGRPEVVLCVARLAEHQGGHCPGGAALGPADCIAPISRGPPLDAQKGLAFVVDRTQGKECVPALRLVSGGDGGRMFVC
jgi:hypothetical protein